MDNIFTDLIDCQKCMFRNIHSDYVPVIPNIKSKVDLMVVGESPTKDEGLMQATYFDRHNSYLQKLISEVFNNDHVYYTYLLKCVNDAKHCLSKIKVKTCKTEYLDKEILACKPKAILYLGSFLAKMHKVPQKEIVRDGDIIKGFWESAFNIYNSGQDKIDEFMTFIRTIRTGVSYV